MGSEGTSLGFRRYINLSGGDRAPPTVFVSVFQCRFCGAIFVTEEGAEGHQNDCSFMQMTNGRIISSTKQMVTSFQFPCPLVVLKGNSICKDERERKTEHVSVKYDTPPPRKSSIKALQKLKRVTSSLRMKSEADCEEAFEDDEWDLESSTCKNESNQRDNNDTDYEYKHKVVRKANRKRPGSNAKRNVKSTVGDGAANHSKFEGVDCPSMCDHEDPRKRPKRKRQKGEGSKMEQILGYYDLRCKDCPARFNDDEMLKRHEYMIHGEGNKDKTIFTCPVCGRMFHFRLLFQSHIKQHEDAEALEEAFDLWNKWPANPRLRKSFSCCCKFCTIPLKTHEYFLSHMTQEHKDRYPKFTCKYCPTTTTTNQEEFESMKLLFRHIQTNHLMEYYGTTTKKNGDDRMECPHCGKILNGYYLEEHLRRRVCLGSNTKIVDKGRMLQVHKPNNPFECPLKGCGAKLKNADRLKAHFILHLENNPYVCTFPGCKVRCDAASHLRRHMKLHFSSAIKCEKCGLFFSRSDKLKTHKCTGAPTKPRALHNYYDSEGNLRSHYAHLRLKRMRSDNAKIPSSSRVKIDSEVKVNEDSEENQVSKEPPMVFERKVDICKVIATDPVFLKVCEEYPDFKKLILPGKRKMRESDVKKEFKCLKCKSSFNTQRSLKNHTTAKHKARPFKCSQCLTSFVHRHNFESHMKAHQDFPDIPGKSQFMIPVDDGSDRLQCTKCGVDRVNELSMVKHWFLKHDVKVPSLYKAVMENSALKKMKAKKKKKSKRRSKKSKWSEDEDEEGDMTIKETEQKIDVKIHSEPELMIDTNAVDKVKVEPTLETEVAIKVEPDADPLSELNVESGHQHLPIINDCDHDNIKWEAGNIVKIEKDE